ncbi:unnamed protein product [Pedinophyceae sp. YPF-701]|nr:unnamed protein product [Pedinophyceae sp. YPF-701]
MGAAASCCLACCDPEPPFEPHSLYDRRTHAIRDLHLCIQSNAGRIILTGTCVRIGEVNRNRRFYPKEPLERAVAVLCGRYSIPLSGTPSLPEPNEPPPSDERDGLLGPGAASSSAAPAAAPRAHAQLAPPAFTESRPQELIGALEHPPYDDPDFRDPARGTATTHRVLALAWEGPELRVALEIDGERSRAARAVVNRLARGGRYGCSVRCWGTLRQGQGGEWRVMDDLEVLTVDLVRRPATDGGWCRPIRGKWRGKIDDSI